MQYKAYRIYDKKEKKFLYIKVKNYLELADYFTAYYAIDTYTRMKSIQGKPIFEHDIVVAVIEDVIRQGTVVKLQGKFYLATVTKNYRLRREQRKELIGNIYKE